MTLLLILILIALSLVLTFYPWRVENPLRPFASKAVALNLSRMVVGGVR